jgi:PKD repeat protein
MRSHVVVESTFTRRPEYSSFRFRVLLVISIACLLFGMDCGGPNRSSLVATNSPTGATGLQPVPALTLTAAPMSGTVPLSVSFGATCTACVTYMWSFGDGSSGSGATATHMYRTAGAYSAVVTATDQYGNTATQTVVITANNGRVPEPVLTLIATPVSGPAPLSVNFVSACLTCVTYAWSFGDGSVGTGPTPTHVYTATGTYSSRVTAADKYGNTATGVAVIAATVLPVLTLTATPLSGIAPLSVSFVATCSTCIAYTWSFGDGAIQGTPGPNQSHIYQSVGTYNVLVEGTDQDGDVTNASVVVTATQQSGSECGKPLFSCLNHTVASIPVPTVPPDAGGPAGANTYVIDPDFHNISVRATDYVHTVVPQTQQWDGNSFQAGCAGGSFCNLSNKDRTLWRTEGMGGTVYLLRFDPVAFALAEALIRNAGDTIPPGLPQSVFGLYATSPEGFPVPSGRFSWKQVNLYYANSGTKILAYCFGISYENGVCSDTLDGISAPTVANGRIVTLVDLANAGPNCLPSTYVPTWIAGGEQDQATDSQFTVAFSSLNEGYSGQTSGGQNTGVHEVAWSELKGCQVLNTYTGVFTADPAWGTNGMTLSLPDRFVIHTAANQDLSGTYMVMNVGGCLTTCLYGESSMLLALGTNTASYLCSSGYGDCGGHSSLGWRYWQNDASNTFLGQDDVRPLPNTSGTYKRTPLIPVPGVTCHGDSHESWVADDPTNVTMFLSTSSATTASIPADVCNDASPLRNEITLYDPTGGQIGRAGHTFNSGYSGRFSIQYAISEWTQMGDFAAWSSDWLETLGDENGNATCPGGTLRFNNWTASTRLAVGVLIFPQAGNPASLLFRVTTTGTTGTTRPTWTQTIGAPVSDGTVQYVNAGSGCRGDMFITDLTSAY